MQRKETVISQMLISHSTCCTNIAKYKYRMEHQLPGYLSFILTQNSHECGCIKNPTYSIKLFFNPK
jgi:hypothetical protein